MAFYQVETFVEHLRELPKVAADQSTPPPALTKPTKVKGWTVKTKLSDQTSDEAKDNEEHALRAIAEALRKQL